MQNSKIDRVVWVDYMKVWCISLMVFAHALPHEILLKLIYAFHMPALFLVSGFLYRPRSPKRLITSFFIPILLYTLIYQCYLIVGTAVFEKTLPGANDLVDRLLHLWQPLFITNDDSYITPHTGVWFLITLIMIRLIAGDVVGSSTWIMKYKYHFIVLTSGGLTVLSILNPLLLEELNNWHWFKVLPCMSFFLMGIVFKEHSNRLLSLRPSMLIVLFLFYVAIALSNERVDLYGGAFGNDYFLIFANALIAILLFSNIFNRYGRKNHYIEVLSSGTFLILGMHSLVVETISVVERKILMVTSPYVMTLGALIATCVTLLCCYWLIVWAEKHFPYLLGKSAARVK